jgi:hypothetical protein
MNHALNASLHLSMNRELLRFFGDRADLGAGPGRNCRAWLASRKSKGRRQEIRLRLFKIAAREGKRT